LTCGIEYYDRLFALTRNRSDPSRKIKENAVKKCISCRKNNLEADNICYKEETTKVKQTTIATKAHYEVKLVDQIKDDSKGFWNYTRHFSRSSATVDMLNHGGEKNPKGDIINNDFMSVLTSEPDNKMIGSLTEVFDANS
jgi:hypothetical protein